MASGAGAVQRASHAPVSPPRRTSLAVRSSDCAAAPIQEAFVMTTRLRHHVGLASLAIALCGCGKNESSSESAAAKADAAATADSASQLVADGQRTFRFETFGNDQFWTDTLHLNDVVEKAVDPTTALKVGLKVDADVLPAGLLEKVDLKSPATTVALLKLNAIVGVVAEVDANNHITRLGITCALCHSTVDNSVMPGIGHRKDGWPNRDLNVGAIVALSPALTAAQRAVY